MTHLGRFEKNNKPVETVRDNKYLVTYWSCCQLER